MFQTTNQMMSSSFIIANAVDTRWNQHQPANGHHPMPLSYESTQWMVPCDFIMLHSLPKTSQNTISWRVVHNGERDEPWWNYAKTALRRHFGNKKLCSRVATITRHRVAEMKHTRPPKKLKLHTKYSNSWQKLTGVTQKISTRKCSGWYTTRPQVLVEVNRIQTFTLEPQPSAYLDASPSLYPAILAIPCHTQVALSTNI